MTDSNIIASHKNDFFAQSVPQTLNLQIKDVQYACDNKAINLNVAVDKKEFKFSMDTGASINLIKMEDIPKNIHVLPFKQTVQAAGILTLMWLEKLT